MKKYLFGIFALVLAISFTAFTNIKDGKDSVTRYWVNDGTYFVEQPGEPSEGNCTEVSSSEKCMIKAIDQSSIPSSFLLANRYLYTTQDFSDNDRVYLIE